MSLAGPNSIPKSLKETCANFPDASDQDAEEAIKFLKGLVQDIRFENTDEITLRERGFPPLDRREQALARLRSWVVSGHMVRFRDPRRLRECLDELEIVIDIRTSHLLDQSDSKLPSTMRIYLATALDGQDDKRRDDDRILRLLRDIEFRRLNVGEKLLILSVSARALRRLDNIERAEKTESDLADYIRTDLRMGIPHAVKKYILRHDETWEESFIGCALGLNCFDGIVEEYVPGKGWTATMQGPDGSPESISWDIIQGDPDLMQYIPSPPAEVNKGGRIQCWVSGCRVDANLKRCSACGKGLYCSPEHQQFAWKMHKKVCKALQRH
ncbi:hypothetical protein FRB90_002645 [Tulasnella sp. 427]|nr:hypothetical protein FRB90_002645 [Tulasnella sp. 427]